MNVVNTCLKEGDMSGILLKDIRWSVKTAGPSPDNNKRTELFLLGCKRAMKGYPCKGCFNSSTWDNSKALASHDPIQMAKHINKTAPNKYITIGGGEPLDQVENVITLCKELKSYGFHIMLYTWRRVKHFNFRDKAPIYSVPGREKQDTLKMLEHIAPFKDELLSTIDIIVDGEFKEEEKLWDGTKEDGFISSIGSGNQIVWDLKKKIGYEMKHINSLSLNENNELIYNLKENNILNLMD